ncbi:MAG TPA: helix-turn-helix transcriptional regulator [Sphingomicrobium sp.]|nr:helix-turn-helix transcriptional regulator [Sphingomicrobium sp.]
MTNDIEAVRRHAAAAATNPALWPETLWKFGRLVGSDMSLFETIDKRTGAVEIGYTDRPDIMADHRDDYEQHYCPNPRWELARSLPCGTVLHDGLIGDDRTLGRFELYVDFLEPSGFKYFIGALAADDAEKTVFLTGQRAPDRGRASKDELQALAAVLPDMANALAFYSRTARTARNATLAAALDLMADPVAVVRGDGRFVAGNRAMHALLASGDLVALDRSRLIGAWPDALCALSLALGRAAEGRRSAAASARGPNGLLIFRAAPLSPEDSARYGAGADPLYCILIDDPALPDWAGVGGAMALFGLTRREAAVGLQLAAGLGVTEIARRLGVSRNTVRTHVARLRDKLGLKSAISVSAQMRRAISPFA